jgi:hypothetical protein
MTLAEAIETTRIHSVAGPYGRPYRLGHDPPVSRPAFATQRGLAGI